MKCDRGQPACGRCLSLNLVCVYGVSQKTGKPPRGRIRLLEAPSTSRTSGEHAHAGNDDGDRRGNTSCSRGTDAYGYDGNCGQILDGHPISLGISVISPDTTRNDHLRPPLAYFTSMEFDDGFLSDMETWPMSTHARSGFESYASPAAQTDAAQAQVGENTALEGDSLQSASNKDHDCFREAYDILGSLSFHRLNNASSIPQSPPPGSASMRARTTNRVPLDHVLRLNREASERLGRLLTCSCSRLPQLTILYASIISQVFICYQQAADCSQSASRSPADMRLDTAPTSHRVSLTGSSSSSVSGSGSGPSTWSSTTARTPSAGRGKNTPPVVQFPGPVAPAKMAIGTFNIDDLPVQNALKIQLLAGEMKRAGRLVDQFALHSLDGQCATDEYTFSDVHSLYQSLDMWLRSEHSRIANMMKAKLRELNC